MRRMWNVVMVVAMVGTAGIAQPTEAETAYFHAYWLEHGMRDFAGAAEAYAKAADALAKTEKKDLLVKALAARGNLLQKLGRAAEAAAVFQRALALDPEQAEVRNALKGTEARAGGTQEAEDEFAAKVRQLIELMAVPVPAAADAREQIEALGAKAAPWLEQALRSRRPDVVSAAARFLLEMEGDAGWKAVLGALGDEAIVHVDPIVQAFRDRPPSMAKLELVSTALKHKNPMVRRQAAQNLVVDDLGFQSPALRDRHAEVYRQGLDTGDVDILRTLLLRPSLPNTVHDAVRAAIEGLLGSEDPDRAQVGLKTVHNSPIPPDVREPLAGPARRAALRWLQADDHPIVHDAGEVLLQAGAWDAEAAGTLHRICERFILNGRPRFKGQNFSSFNTLGPLAILVSEKARIVPAPEPALELFRLAGTRESTLPPNEIVNFRRGLVKRVAESKPDLAAWAPVVKRGLETVQDPEGLAIWLGLANSLDTDIQAEALRLAGHENPSVRLRACQALVNLDKPLPEGWIPPKLREDLASGWHEMQLCSLTLAERIGGEAMVPAVAALVQGDTNVTSRAIVVLARIGGRAALPALRERLARKPTDPPALKALVGILGEESVGDLVAASGGSSPGNVLASLTGGGGTPATRDAGDWAKVLKHWLAQTPREGRDSAFVRMLLDQLNESDARALALDILEHGPDDARPAVIAAAGSRHFIETWPFLVKLLDHPNEGIRKSSQAALEELKSYRELKRGLEDFGPEGRAQAVKNAQSLLDSPDAALRRGAAFALGALADPAAVPPLLKLLRDSDAAVRDAAVQALQKLSAPK